MLIASVQFESFARMVSKRNFSPREPLLSSKGSIQITIYAPFGLSIVTSHRILSLFKTDLEAVLGEKSNAARLEIFPGEVAAAPIPPAAKKLSKLNAGGESGTGADLRFKSNSERRFGAPIIPKE